MYRVISGASGLPLGYCKVKMPVICTFCIGKMYNVLVVSSSKFSNLSNNGMEEG